MGHYNFETQTYDSINEANIQWGVDNVRNLMLKWGHHPAVYALEPANEPWDKSDLPTLFDFYRRVRATIREINPAVKFVFHDSFRPKASIWNDLFADDDIENTVLDNHTYLAWAQPRNDDVTSYCGTFANTLKSEEFSKIKYETWVGEWSLATDVCAWWLGGFNESYNFDYQFPCEWVDCPYSYLPKELAVDFDRTVPLMGPHGSSDRALIRNGQCARDSTFFSKDEVQVLADCMLEMFHETVQGQFLWTFRNELEDKWNYITAYDLGWLNQNKTKAFLK